MPPSRDRKHPHRLPSTILTHSGRDPASQHGFVNTPAYRGSTVLYPTLESLRSNTQPFSYGRWATPTTRALETAITELEGGAVSVITPSGLLAISATIFALVGQGDTILVADTVYKPTRTFCDRVLSRFGINTIYYDPTLGSEIKKLITKDTKLIFLESPGSLTFEVQDVPAIAEVAKKNNLWLVLDNTWATPLFFKPLEYGIDVSIHAATKYIVGHADAMLGIVTGNERAAKHLIRIKDNLGICPGSEEVYLGLRGLRTLDVRLTRHQASAIKIANWLNERPEITKVLSPVMPDDPGHKIWKRDFTGASGLFAALLHPTTENALAAFLDHLNYFGMGYSWGGYESLILPVDPRAVRTATQWTHAGQLLRLHIGLEDPEDLIGDLRAGFDRLNHENNRA